MWLDGDAVSYSVSKVYKASSMPGSGSPMVHWSRLWSLNDAAEVKPWLWKFNNSSFLFFNNGAICGDDFCPLVFWSLKLYVTLLFLFCSASLFLFGLSCGGYQVGILILIIWILLNSIKLSWMFSRFQKSIKNFENYTRLPWIMLFSC